MRQRYLPAAGLTAAVMVFVQSALAERAACSVVRRTNVAQCAVAASLDRAAERASVDAAEGRVTATEPWFPSRPTLAVTAARREGAEGKALNWSASLDVELEIAGQRGARRRAALAERDAQQRRVAVAERTVAAEAWVAYFDAIAARDRSRLMKRLESTSERVWKAALAAADGGTGAGVDADIAEATYLGVMRRRAEAVRDEAVARSTLALLVGLQDDHDLVLVGGLAPLESVDAAALASAEPTERPEVAALEAEGRAQDAYASAYRRARVPNPTLSVFAATEGFGDRILGLGLAFPLPLPQPLGRSYAGEIAESDALGHRARLLATRGRRVARHELSMALRAYESAREVERTYSAERTARAERTLTGIADEIEAGRLAVRDAVVAQEPLLGVLLAAIEAKRSVCLASVEVARAVGLPLERGRP